MERFKADAQHGGEVLVDQLVGVDGFEDVLGAGAFGEGSVELLDVVEALVDGADEDVFFAGEVRVDGPGGQPGGFDDVAHGGVGVAVVEEAVDGGFDDLGATCGFGGVC